MPRCLRGSGSKMPFEILIHAAQSDSVIRVVVEAHEAHEALGAVWVG